MVDEEARRKKGGDGKSKRRLTVVLDPGTMRSQLNDLPIVLPMIIVPYDKCRIVSPSMPDTMILWIPPFKDVSTPTDTPECRNTEHA